MLLRLLAPVGGGMPQRCRVPLGVDTHDDVPLVLGHVDEHPVAEDAGVVDQHVEPAERPGRSLDQRRQGVGVEQIGGGADGRIGASGIELVTLLFRFAGRTVKMDADIGALGMKAAGQRSTDAAGRASDQHRTLGECVRSVHAGMVNERMIAASPADSERVA